MANSICLNDKNVFQRIIIRELLTDSDKIVFLNLHPKQERMVTYLAITVTLHTYFTFGAHVPHAFNTAVSVEAMSALSSLSLPIDESIKGRAARTCTQVLC